jgi:death on curing protein
MAGNHGFADGNKRTTLILLYTFLLNSGYVLKGIAGEDIQQAIEDTILLAASSQVPIEELNLWFKARINRL